MEYFRMEGTSENSLVKPSAQSRVTIKAKPGCSGLFTVKFQVSPKMEIP